MSVFPKLFFPQKCKSSDTGNLYMAKWIHKMPSESEKINILDLSSKV